MTIDDTVETRLRSKCHSTFGADFGDSLSECYGLLTQLVNLKVRGIGSCEIPLVVAHDANFYSKCGSVEQLINRYLLPLFQLFCLIGNLLNLLIYHLPYFRGSSAVYFFQAKAIANLIFVESRLFEVVHAWTPEASPSFEAFYWHSRPFVITVANISGTLSTWLTLLVTIETVICVLMPLTFRHYFTRRRTIGVLIGALLCSTALHSIYLATHRVEMRITIEMPLKTAVKAVHNFYTRPTLLGSDYIEVSYYWCTAMVSIVLPTLLMLLCSMLIVTRFSAKSSELGVVFSQRRRCGASSEVHNGWMCALNHGINLLSIANATVPFFVFLACNDQFRAMSIRYMRAWMRGEGIKAGNTTSFTREQLSENLEARRTRPIRPFGGLSLPTEEERCAMMNSTPPLSFQIPTDLSLVLYKTDEDQDS